LICESTTIQIKEMIMRDNLRLYHTFLRQLGQWLPKERVTRRRNLALLVAGIYFSGRVHLSLIVRQWPLAGKAPSLVNRLRRFLTNQHVSLQRYYEPVVKKLFDLHAGNHLRLVIDTTHVGLGHRALVVGLCYRKRTLPLAWSVHKGTRGNTAVTAQIALLAWLHKLIPAGTEVSLTGDAAFRTGDLLHWLADHGWSYVIRQRKEVNIRQAQGPWHPIADVDVQPGQTKVVGWVYLAKSNPFGLTWLLLHWEKGEEAPWILVSNHADARWVIKTYRRRMWIEEMFGDMKRHGFNLQATHLRHIPRIERLMLGVCLAYVWLISLGSWVVKNGKRHFIDRKDRRDKSYFRLGWDWVERCFRHGQPIKLRFGPYF
jgi:hypothetical protein